MVGVRGCGKTTLIRSVLPKIGRFEYITTDTVIRSLVGTQYAQFNNFPDEVKKQTRSRAIMYMREETERFHAQLIVEDHATLYNPNTRKIERVLPEESSFFYTDMILLSVDPGTVLRRRRSDLLVKRTLDLEFIKREVQAEEAEARKYADIVGMDFHLIKDEGGPEPALKLLRLLSGYP
jgi:adenylate kinase